MHQHFHYSAWNPRSGWSTISAGNETSFTIWFTGLPGTGKSILSHLVRQALVARGYKVEILDGSTLPYWLKHELHIEDPGPTSPYDAFIAHICTLLARNGIITITISPYQEAPTYAREQIQHFIEVYLHCPADLRRKRLKQQELTLDMAEHTYQPSINTELSIDTNRELLERSALRIIAYLEQAGYVAPIWEGSTMSGSDEEEIELVRTRLRALGYLE